MFCTKCGNELKDGDLFCGKCGTKANDEAASAQADVSSEPSKTSTSLGGSPGKANTSRGLKSGLKRKVKRACRLPPLVVNGVCRYCGTRLDATATVCRSCGAKSPERIAGEKSVAKSLTQADLARAAGIGESLGSGSLTGSMGHDDGLFGEGCIFLPFIVINPLFWVSMFYKSQAMDALKAGKLDEAEKLKNMRTIFDVLGFLFIFVEMWIAWKIFEAHV